MIFHALGQLMRRYWLLWLVGWAALTLGTYYAAPPWEDVAQDRELDFLPANTPSLLAGKKFAEAFPEDRLASSIVLVLTRQQQGAGLVERDKKFIEEVLEPELRQIAEKDGGLAGEIDMSDEPLFGDDPAPAMKKPAARKSVMARIRTPNAPGIGALLISPNGQALLVVVELTTEFFAVHNWDTIERIEAMMADLKARNKLPPGTALHLTGSAVIGRDHNKAQADSAKATELLTVVLVVALLVLIYRAPLLAIIPLATVYLAVLVSRNVLAILGGAGYVQLFQGIEIYITILAYGAGVDYCLFLMARYKEELDRGRSPGDALARTIEGVGAALVASAATVAFGIGMMVFAQFGKFRTAGIAIPLSIVMALLATLTFSPALLRMAGWWAFWPGHAGPTAPASTARATGWLRYLQAGGLTRTWEVMGEILRRRPGLVWLVAAGLMLPFVAAGGALYNHLSYDLIGDLPAAAPSVAGTRVLQEHFPAGIIGPVTVLLVDPSTDFGAPDGKALVDKLTERLRAEKKQLGLADIRTLTEPLGITETAAHAFIGSDVPAEVRQEATDRAARERYTTALGERKRTGTRLDLVLEQSPFAPQSLKMLDRIADTLRAALPATSTNAQLYFTGTTASVRDLAAVMQGDRQRIEWFVLGSVFLILIVLLREIVVPIYLLLSVLFSYYATLGASFAVFYLLDPQGFTGIDWKVAIFLFTILIAVGEDYNILLLARVREEERQRGAVQGIVTALTETGPIISSCGIIMAGTFASLMAGSLTEMKQLGFALAFGILLDTFVVRPLLVPAFLLLLHSGRLPLLGRGLEREGERERGREGEGQATRSH